MQVLQCSIFSMAVAFTSFPWAHFVPVTFQQSNPSARIRDPALQQVQGLGL